MALLVAAEALPKAFSLHVSFGSLAMAYEGSIALDPKWFIEIGCHCRGSETL